MERLPTTITLDPEVAAQLEVLAQRRHTSIETALATAVLNELAAAPAERVSFRVEARPMGLRPGTDLTHALQLAADLEDAELIRKLQNST